MGKGGFRAPGTKQNPFCLQRSDGRAGSTPSLGPWGTCRCSRFLPYRPTCDCTERFSGDAPRGGLFLNLGNPGELNHCSAHPGHQQTGYTMGISMGCSGMPAAPPDRAGMCAHPFGIQGYPFPVLLIPLLTRQEGIGGGVGLLLADVGEGDAAVAVLPPPG